jgi:uncharacterized protein
VTKWVALAATGATIIFAGHACAQELSCRQLFMNASEKRICATPELMQLDQQMGELAREVELHQNGFKSDQRQFRRALKTCDGDVPCLGKTYNSRIRELQAVAGTLPPPTTDETIELEKEAVKAEKKRDAQADARARLVQKLAKKDAAVALSTSALAQAPISEVPLEALGSANKPDTTVTNSPQTSAPSSEVLDAESVNSTVPVEPPIAQDVAANTSEQSIKSSDDDGWIGRIVFAVVALMVIAWIRSGLHRLFKVCPKCKKWGAGAVVDRDHSSHTDYEMRTFTDQHRDRRGMPTSSTVKQRQVAVRVTDTVETLKCRVCNHVWELHSRSKSG